MRFLVNVLDRYFPDGISQSLEFKIGRKIMEPFYVFVKNSFAKRFDCIPKFDEEPCDDLGYEDIVQEIKIGKGKNTSMMRKIYII